MNENHDAKGQFASGSSSGGAEHLDRIKLGETMKQQVERELKETIANAHARHEQALNSAPEHRIRQAEHEVYRAEQVLSNWRAAGRPVRSAITGETY